MRLDSSPTVTRGFVLRAALPLVAALALSACAGMNETQPQATLLKAPALGLSADPSTVVSLQDAWWREFGDAQLDRLIDRALASNPNLKIAQARLARAQADFEECVRLALWRMDSAVTPLVVLAPPQIQSGG